MEKIDSRDSLKRSMEELNRLSVEGFKEVPKSPVAIVLDNIRSLHNVGSVFRTSDAFRVERLCLCGITAQPPHREITKTALGATDSVDWNYYATTVKCIEELRSLGYAIYAIEQVKESRMLDQISFETGKKIAFVFGNEAFGVEDEVLKICDGFIEIPQFGTKHSFNITISVGIVLWQYHISTSKAK